MGPKMLLGSSKGSQENICEPANTDCLDSGDGGSQCHGVNAVKQLFYNYELATSQF